MAPDHGGCDVGCDFHGVAQERGAEAPPLLSAPAAQHGDAADATQETYLRLLTALARTPIDNPQAYLFQIARNVASSAGARRKLEASLFDADSNDLIAGIPDSAARVEEQVCARAELRRLAVAIDGLPPRCREAFLLSRIDGLSNGEVATRLGVTRNMVEKHLIRAMLHCRRHCRDLF